MILDNAIYLAKKMRAERGLYSLVHERNKLLGKKGSKNLRLAMFAILARNNIYDPTDRSNWRNTEGSEDKRGNYRGIKDGCVLLGGISGVINRLNTVYTVDQIAKLAGIQLGVLKRLKYNRNLTADKRNIDRIRKLEKRVFSGKNNSIYKRASGGL